MVYKITDLRSKSNKIVLHSGSKWDADILGDRGCGWSQSTTQYDREVGRGRAGAVIFKKISRLFWT